MLKKILCLPAMVLLAAATASAQLYIAPGTDMLLTGNTTLAIASLLLVPSANLTLSDINFLHSNTPVPGVGGSGISQVYTLNTPLNFQGMLGLYYADNQLNGNTAATLQLAYKDGATGNWRNTAGTVVNTTTHFLSRNFATPVSLAGMTAASGGVALPVIFFDLTAQAEERRVLLNGVIEITESETVCELERSSDGQTFIHLETVPVTSDRRSYRFYDEQPATGVNFYRLRRTEGNGSTRYSPVRSVLFSKDIQQGLTLYPVPVHNMLYLSIPGNPAAGSAITITSTDGRVLIRKELSGQTTSIDLHSYASGTYLLSYYNGSAIRLYKITKTD